MALNFALNPAGYVYRPLKKGDNGWDIYALQTALNHFGELKLVEDGYFGDDTRTKVVRYQRNRKLTADGIAGIVTQRTIALEIAKEVSQKTEVPFLLLKGQLEKESGFQLGNHSEQYKDGSFDVGVTQRNTNYHPIDDGFNTLKSLFYLARYIKDYYQLYHNANHVSNERAWELGAGAWNRPAYTNFLANVRPWAVPNDAQLEWIEGYIDRVTVYMQDKEWPEL